MHSPVPLGEQREPKQPPFLRPAPTLRYALGVPTVLFQKVRHGSQVTPVEVAGSATSSLAEPRDLRCCGTPSLRRRTASPLGRRTRRGRRVGDRASPVTVRSLSNPRG